MGMLYGIMFRNYKLGKEGLYTTLAKKLHTSYAYRVIKYINIIKIALYVLGIALTSTVVFMVIPI